MDIYQKNILALEKKYPQLAKKMRVQEFDSAFEVVPTKTAGYFTVKILKDSKEMYLHSLYNPKVESQRWVDSLQGFKAGDILYVLGFGCGYHIRLLLEKTQGQNKIIVLDTETELFNKVLLYIDISDIIEEENVCLVIEDDLHKFKSLLKPYIPPGKLDEMQGLTFPGYQRIFSKECDRMSDVFIKLARNMRMTENTMLNFAKLWPENIFKNLIYTVSSVGVKKLFNTFVNKPAIVISAGPSLSKNCELLKEAKDKAVLICVDTALKALLKRGIKPDLVIALDGSELNYRHFEGIDVEDVPLVYIPVTHYKILEEYKSPKIVSAGANSLTDWINKYIEDKGAIGFGGSVATAAFDLAIRMGANPIIFVGQDLAYPNNKSHADGTIYEMVKVEDDGARNKLYVEDIEGNMVLTDASLYYYLQWFEDAIRTLNNKLVIDATEGGAKIAGTKIMTLREVIDQYCNTPVNSRKIIEDILSSNQSINIKELVTALKEVITGLTNLEKYSRKGLMHAEDLNKEFAKRIQDRKCISKLVRAMDKIDKKIKDEESNNFINIMMQPILMSVMKGNVAKPKEDESEQERGQRIASRSAMLYKGIEAASKDMSNLIRDAVNSLEKLSLKGAE